MQNCICCFRGEALKIEGGPEATASFASPNIHHCRGIEIHRLRKVKTGFAKRAEIPRTGSLNVPKFQERVRANPCEPPESHHWLRCFLNL